MKQSDAIKSISYDQSEILNNIIKLYCPEGFGLDPTFSKGNYYKNVPMPKVYSDINPQVAGCIRADCTKLPFLDRSFKAINIDLPFLNTQPIHETADNDIMHKRFSFFKNNKDMHDVYLKSFDEAYRLLQPEGIFVVKCQDYISSGKQYLFHVDLINYAVSIGFYPLDLFVLLNNVRPLSGKVKIQRHCRKYHTYMLVFMKKRSPVKYTSYVNVVENI